MQKASNLLSQKQKKQKKKGKRRIIDEIEKR